MTFCMASINNYEQEVVVFLFQTLISCFTPEQPLFINFHSVSFSELHSTLPFPACYRFIFCKCQLSHYLSAVFKKTFLVLSLFLWKGFEHPVNTAHRQVSTLITGDTGKGLCFLYHDYFLLDIHPQKNRHCLYLST